MPRAKLSASFVLSAQCIEGRKKTDYYDTETKGFVLEVRSTGGRSYYLRYPNAAGQQKQKWIGRAEDITFAAARKRAQRLRSEVTLGGDPVAEKAQAKAVPKYAELAAMHLADAQLHQRSYDTLEMYVRRHILPRWGKVRLTDIDGRAVAQWLADKRAEGLAPATVVKIKAIFGRSFELGLRWGIAGCERNPVRGIQMKAVDNARQRYVTAEEAERLIAAADTSRNPQLSAIVSLLLLTGMRVSELLSARWANVDLERRTLFVPMSKTGRSRFVPLAQAAVDEIRQMPRGEFLFPNPRHPAKHLTTIKHGWQTARDAAGLPGLRIHDLRHSAASFMVNSGVDLFAVGKVLGHANVASSARYSHLAQDTLLAAVEAGAAKQQARPA
ncbi:site-specific integrase [Sphingomonas sp. A2-49]|uniref:site-specific integrase n=1 Tax=Sphingomonas sp. A2-49 TaxID=1391375 RepID=UPI0021CE9475|nr:site-specific integrase [Sphingomonas sp. A2-49]MCU6453929.1 site-specific integrase [Sphingomonas sp. A2-49]